MHTLPSAMSLAAAGVYLIVVLACICAAVMARARRHPQHHFMQWLLLAALFGCLMAMRLTNFEENILSMIRQDMRAGGEYQHRREFQRPLAAAAIFLFAGLGLWASYWVMTRGSGRRYLAVGLAGLAGLGMIGLVALRLVSLHQIDVLLYGPLKLNWFADIGLTLLVGAAAAYYVRLLTAR